MSVSIWNCRSLFRLALSMGNFVAASVSEWPSGGHSLTLAATNGTRSYLFVGRVEIAQQVRQGRREVVNQDSSILENQQLRHERGAIHVCTFLLHSTKCNL